MTETLLNLVITRHCGTRLLNKMFMGFGTPCLEREVMEVKDEIPFEEATIEGFVFVPNSGWQKVLMLVY